MTQQVKQAYRKNRRATWLVALAVIVLAGIAIPFASGAPDKTYELQTSPLVVCSGDTLEMTLTLTNTAKTANLGSAEIRLPAAAVEAKSEPGPQPPLSPRIFSISNGSSSPTVSLTGDTLRLENLDLAAKKGLNSGGSVTVKVEVLAKTGSGLVEAVAKQSNSFNDNQGDDANSFANPAFETLSASPCTGTIKGTVWNDKNEDRTVGAHAVEPRQTFNVYLYRSDGTLAQTVSANEQATGDATNNGGGYTFSNVALNRSYVVCIGDPGGGSWAQSKPKPDQSSGLCDTKGHEASGYALNFTASVTGIDFGNVNTISVDCSSTDPNDLRFITSTPDSTYTVQIASGTLCGKSAEFVFEAYAQGDVARVANLHPLSGGSGAVHIVEKMEWAFTGTAQPDPANRSLKYDDDLTDNGGVPNPEPMPYCLLDPRDGTEFGLDTTTGVLPSEHTSCLIESTETAGGERVDYAYSSVDGYRAFP